MASLAKVIVIGNVGRDPEKRYSSDGKPVTKFSVAATTRKRDKDGEWSDHTEWFNVTTFGRLAEATSERLTKGSRVYVEGRLESRTYETKDGKKGFSLDVAATDVIITADSNPRPNTSQEVTAVAAPRAIGGSSTDEPVDLEDLPF